VATRNWWPGKKVLVSPAWIEVSWTDLKVFAALTRDAIQKALADVARHLELETELRDVTPEILLQGPFSDAMTHAGQLDLLRRLAGSPIPPENFIFAEIKVANLAPDQPLPARPDEVWPEKP
jgi:hypothetical protein